MSQVASTSDERFKHALSFFLFMLTILWALICLVATLMAVDTSEPGWIVAASGTGGVTGSFLTFDALIIQHWFRRAKPE